MKLRIHSHTTFCQTSPIFKNITILSQTLSIRNIYQVIYLINNIHEVSPCEHSLGYRDNDLFFGGERQ